MSDDRAIQLTKEIENAVLEWWESYRPITYSVKDHMGNPAVNMTRESAHRLAEAAAELAAKQMCANDHPPQ